MFENTKGSSLRDNIFARVLVDNDEVRGSQYFETVSKEDGDFVTVGSITCLTRIRKDNIVKLQYQVGDTDLHIAYPPGAFDKNTAASIVIRQLEAR